MTKYFAVIGDPVGHSLSPAIHHLLYEIHHVNGSYRPLRIRKNLLESELPRLIQEYELSGFNVTMPHKQAIIPLLASISKDAALAHSVNTVVCGYKGLHGYSTDALGFSQAVAASGRNPQGLPAVFLGSGGACGALALHWALFEKAPVTIIARTPEKAKAIQNTIVEQGGASPLILAWNEENISKAMAETPLLVNTTPLGMTGNTEDFPDFHFLEHLPKNSLVFDLIYAPRQTQLLQKAKESGHCTANGLDMLIYQAMEAFTILTGVQTEKKDKLTIEKALAGQGLLKD